MAEATEAVLAGPAPPQRLRAALKNGRVLFGGSVLAALVVLAVCLLQSPEFRARLAAPWRRRRPA